MTDAEMRAAADRADRIVFFGAVVVAMILWGVW